MICLCAFWNWSGGIGTGVDVRLIEDGRTDFVAKETTCADGIEEAIQAVELGWIFFRRWRFLGGRLNVFRKGALYPLPGFNPFFDVLTEQVVSTADEAGLTDMAHRKK